MRFRLVPTDDRFFDLFNESARNVEECARRLREYVLDPATDADGKHSRVVECERRGDELTAAILHRLDTTFVTPFDREDIHALAEELDDVVDDIHAVSALLHLIPMGKMLPEVCEQADVLVRMASENVKLVERLQSMKETKKLLESIDQLESEGDAVYRRVVARLFSGEFEALDVLKWKDIVHALEAALNTLEDISDVVESIILKHA
jgi:predicted phosphate transport protein (TIGR00153 family)